MQRVSRLRMSARDRVVVWAQWTQGASLSEIGRTLGACRRRSFMWCARGGVPPPGRFRSARALSVSDREAISRGLARGVSLRQLGAQLGRPTSTVSREVARHGGRHAYRATAAEATTWDRARRPQACCLATRPGLRVLVAEKLAARWSPQQIAGWLRRTYPQDTEMQVSHETIYRSLFVQSRGVLKQELLRHLRRRRTTAAVAAGQRAPAASRDRRCDLHPRAAGERRGSGGAGALGGRPPRRERSLVHRDLGRAALALRRPGARAEQGHAERRGRAHPLRAPAADGPDDHAHMGLRDGTRRAQDLHHRDRRPGVRFAIRTARGNAARTRTPTACSASTSRTGPISR